MVKLKMKAPSPTEKWSCRDHKLKELYPKLQNKNKVVCIKKKKFKQVN